jgi:SCP1.201-like deaminase
VIGRAFGRLVLVALVVFGVWYVVDHYHGTSQFGCQASGAVAHADSGDCPTSIGGADGDAQWAVERIASMPRTGSTTTGLFYDPDGHETRYTSEQDGDSDAALNTGRDAGVFPSKGRPNVVDHVEMKAAAAMRAGNVASGVLVINYPGPPCGELPGGTVQPLSCSAIVPRMLPPGATLVVWWQEPGSRPEPTRFTGGRS